MDKDLTIKVRNGDSVLKYLKYAIVWTVFVWYRWACLTAMLLRAGDSGLDNVESEWLRRTQNPVPRVLFLYFICRSTDFLPQVCILGIYCEKELCIMRDSFWNGFEILLKGVVLCLGGWTCKEIQAPDEELQNIWFQSLSSYTENNVSV